MTTYDIINSAADSIKSNAYETVKNERLIFKRELSTSLLIKL